MDADVVVVGAGAAGLIAAATAARAGRRVALLEKKDRAGLKILISGGGRCNLTTTREGSALEAEYGPGRGRWLRHALRSFPPRALRAMVEAAGVPLQEEDLEKVFPVSGRARDVVDALLRLAAAAGVAVRLASPMTAMRPVPGGFAVAMPGGEISARNLVLATGGQSYPRTGTTGDGYRVCVALGHRIETPRPALAPLLVEAEWVRRLAGITLTAGLALRDRSSRLLCHRQRPVLFTHRGLSGPAAMDVSGWVEEAGGGCALHLDFAPEVSSEQVRAALLAAARGHGRRQAAAALPAALPDRLRQALAVQAGATCTAAELRREQRETLVRLVKDSKVTVDRSLGFAHAEVTRGGVALAEVNPATMESRLVPGLFVCGELLDVDGPIGGFNFQAAFATGRLAGDAAAKAAGEPHRPSNPARRTG